MAEPLTLDVREELRGGGEPLPRILQAVNNLAPGQALRLLATFEPLPLYAVLGHKGFEHQAVRHGEGNWEVLFSPSAARAAPSASAASAARGPRAAAPSPSAAREAHSTDVAGWPAPSTTVDNRGLQPPEPLVRILDALERLGPGEVLEAFNERDPVFLYPELQARGAAIRTEKVGGAVRLLIRRAAQSSARS